ncbi:MAG: hypothetical protein ABJF88_16285 [Rhodothermales bacterium]
MSDWYEVFDNEQVQFDTRRRVARLVGVLVVVLGAIAGAIPLILLYVPFPFVALGLVGLVVAGILAWASRAFLRLRSVVWCVKLSVHRVVGYDYARRKSVLPWTEVERVELDAAGLVIAQAPAEGRPGRVFRIPHLFPDFPRLSHRVVEYAEAHGLPVCVDGRPWQLLDLSALYPFMAECAIAGSVDPSRGRALEGGDEA